MSFPLGSFQRFGHQDRRANERLQRSQAKSAFTRRCQAEEHLEKEVALVEIFSALLAHSAANDVGGEAVLVEVSNLIGQARRRHTSGKRIHYGHFAVLFKSVVRGCEQNLEVLGMEQEEIRAILEDLADRHLCGERVVIPNERDCANCEDS